MPSENLTFTPRDGEATRVAVDLSACDAFGTATQGHLYRVDMYGTLEDLAQLVRHLQRYECPDISAVGWAELQLGGSLEPEEELEEEEVSP